MTTRHVTSLHMNFDSDACVIAYLDFAGNQSFEFWQLGPNAPGPGSEGPTTWDGIGDRPVNWTASRDLTGEYEAAAIAQFGSTAWDILKPMWPRPEYEE